jgi:hypothetical protein
MDQGNLREGFVWAFLELVRYKYVRYNCVCFDQSAGNIEPVFSIHRSIMN